MNYFAIAVPAKVTAALKTFGPVPIMAKINGGAAFRGSLYPLGDGHHRLRVKASVRAQAKIEEGDQVSVTFTVVDRDHEIGLPLDLQKALQLEGVLEGFQALPPGKLSFTLRWIEQAARPETRNQRIQKAIEMAHQRRERESSKK